MPLTDSIECLCVFTTSEVNMDISAHQRRVIFLILTHQCNLNCTYCYEKHKDECSMTFDTAQRILVKEFELVAQSPLYNHLEINFMGGEPFLEMELIHKIIDWVSNQTFPIPYSFFATTNGTLLTAEVKEWLIKHSSIFQVALSYDGTSITQNRNRSNSASKIDLDFFRAVFPKQGIKMTFSPQCVDSLYEGLIELYSRGFCIEANVAYGTQWTEKELCKYQEQLLLLARYYLEKPNVEKIAMFKPLFNCVFGITPPPRTCHSGNTLVTYDIDGNMYPCQFFTPLVLGSQRAYCNSLESFCQHEYIDPFCKSCSMVAVCKTCYGLNYMKFKDISKRDETLCEINKIQFAVNAWYYIELLKEKKKSGMEWNETEYAIAKGIVFYHQHPPKSKQAHDL